MMHYSKNVNWAIQTGGDGFWSSRSAVVEVTEISLNWTGDNGHVEVNITFDPNTWNVERDGLIYTDRLFLEGLRRKFVELLGHNIALDYTEQGMQGDDYVSLESYNMSPYESVFDSMSPEEIIAEIEKHYENIMIEAGHEPFNGKYHE
jgi:hypothetical protein